MLDILLPDNSNNRDSFLFVDSCCFQGYEKIYKEERITFETKTYVLYIITYFYITLCDDSNFFPFLITLHLQEHFFL